MATLVSPGVDVQVIDESQYTPGVAGSIPYVLLATAQNKISGTSDSIIAAGTTPDVANVVTPVSSQRELIALFGVPTFQVNTIGTVVQGHELNEYGLQTAYSVLGITNQIYVQRANIDLGELLGTSVRPTNNPADGTLWLDIENTNFGMFEWTEFDQTFNKIYPTVIDALTDTTGGIPNEDVLGPYAIVTTSVSNPVYFRNAEGIWNLVGSDNWIGNTPIYTGTVATPTVVIGDTLTINTTVITMTGTDLAQTVLDINTASGGGPITGVTVADVDNKLAFFVTAAATSNGAVVDGKLDISASSSPGANEILDDLGISIGIYNILAVQLSAHTGVPEWKTTDTTPRPTGSIWIKTTSPNLGADVVVNSYSDEIDEWSRVSAMLYYNDAATNKAMDPTGGGVNINAGSMYTRYDIQTNNTVTYSLYERAVKGATKIVGSQTDFVINPLTISDKFTMAVSQQGYSDYTAEVIITMTGTTAGSMVFDIMNAAIVDVTAAVEPSGAVSITHLAGGVIVLKNQTGIPLTDAGFSASTIYVEDGNNGDLIGSTWTKPVYTASVTQPSIDPVDGTYWYNSEIDNVDIMIHDGTGWKGYQNVSNDSRGYDLSVTNPTGPIVAASEPTTQTDNTPLESGDIWINTQTLAKFPTMYRWTALGGGNEGWVLIDIADQTTENGIVFADARWDTDGTTDVIINDFPDIVDLLTSDYLDLDAPDHVLYPRGTLLWNTRRSGFNVKQYVVDYFNSNTFEGPYPTETSTWKTASGLRADGSPYMGDEAVRAIIVAAMKSGLDSSLSAREELNMFNLIVAPGYPELISNMVTLNVDRKETAFIIGDSPMTLAATSIDLQNWANNTSLANDNGNDGLVSNDEYLGVYYPAGLTNDLNGNSIVMPTSYMALRTMIRSDNVSYPWIAPAGVRRGSVDNATSIGYIDADTSEYQSIAVGQGLRDVLYTARINPISVLPAVGITVYGQKTRSTQASAMDRINVARLIAHLRYVLSILAKPFVFEPNDKLTRDEIKQEIEKYMNELIAKRAIYDYLVVCDRSNNTPSRIDRNELWVDVAIEPVKAVEFIYVPIRIKNTGEI